MRGLSGRGAGWEGGPEKGGSGRPGLGLSLLGGFYWQEIQKPSKNTKETRDSEKAGKRFRSLEKGCPRPRKGWEEVQKAQKRPRGPEKAGKRSRRQRPRRGPRP